MPVEKGLPGLERGRVTLVEQPLFGLRQGVGNGTAELAQSMRVAGDLGRGEQALGRVGRKPDPLELERADDVADLRQAWLEPRAQVPDLGVLGVGALGEKVVVLGLLTRGSQITELGQSLGKRRAVELSQASAPALREGFRVTPCSLGMRARLVGRGEEPVERPAHAGGGGFGGGHLQRG